jgi:hypothetical protein
VQQENIMTINERERAEYVPISDERRMALAAATAKGRERDLVPFRFEDLNGEPEPEHWGPKYSRPVAKPKPVNDETRIPTNAPSGQKGPIVDDAKLRAKLKAEFDARCNAERKAWAMSTHIVAAYEQAMAAKHARIAAELAKRKPHYVLRAGEWKLAA